MSKSTRKGRGKRWNSRSLWATKNARKKKIWRKRRKSCLLIKLSEARPTRATNGNPQQSKTGQSSIWTTNSAISTEVNTKAGRTKSQYWTWRTGSGQRRSQMSVLTPVLADLDTPAARLARMSSLCLEVLSQNLMIARADNVLPMYGSTIQRTSSGSSWASAVGISYRKGEAMWLKS